MNTAVIANITKIQRFSIHDGPGIRTTVFFKGCPLRCSWCHNPETQESQRNLMYNQVCCTFCGQCEAACRKNVHNVKDGMHIVDHMKCDGCSSCIEACNARALTIQGYKITLEDVMKTIRKDIDYYDETSGGVTLSGGEPLMQPEFAKALIVECRQKGIHVCLDTCGFANPVIFHETVDLCECILFDLKAIDPVLHKKATGMDNTLILDNFKAACLMGKEMIVREVVIPGINDSRDNFEKTAELLSTTKFRGILELLPYHGFGKNKYMQMGRAYELDGIQAPTSEFMQNVMKFYKEKGIQVRIGN